MGGMPRCWEKKETNNKAGVNRALSWRVWRPISSILSSGYLLAFLWVPVARMCECVCVCVSVWVGVSMYCSPITAILSMLHNTTG